MTYTMTLQEAKDKVAQSKGFIDRYDMGARANWMEKDANEAAELYCQSQKAQAWEECYRATIKIITPDVKNGIVFRKPVNPYLIFTSKNMINIIFKAFEGEENWPHLVEMPEEPDTVDGCSDFESEWDNYENKLRRAKANAIPFQRGDRKKVIIKMIDEEIIESDCIEDIDPEKIYSIGGRYKIEMNHTEHCKIECWCDNEDRVAILLKEEIVKEAEKEESQEDLWDDFEAMLSNYNDRKITIPSLMKSKFTITRIK